jgi:aspartate/methionine/tyrosine aminotransferase
MSQNTNHIPTDPSIQEVLHKAVDEREYNKYPFAKGIFGLSEAIKEDLGLQEFDVLLSAGGSEALYIAMRAFLPEGSETITTDPSFFMIHNYIKLSFSKPTNLPVYQPPWKLSIEQVKEAINEKTRMILFIDPLNPLGTCYTKDEVKAICDLAVDHNLIIFDDITYRDFADEHHLTTEFAPDNTLIAYSFSKNCGMAGMRMGALVCPPELMKTAKPYNTNDLSVNVLAQRAALQALKTKSKWMKNVVGTCRRNQAHIKAAVEKTDGCFLPVYPSQANMFVIDIHETGLKPVEIQDELLFKHNIFVRAGDYVSRRFGSNFIRVSFCVPEEGAKKFADLFPEVVDKIRG